MNQDYSGKDLRVEDFHDKNLEKCNFQGSDIRGVNFTNANLNSANFKDTKAGLQPHWATGLVIISFIIAALLVSIFQFLGNRTFTTIIVTNTGTTPETIWDNIWVAAIILVMSIVFTYSIFKSLQSAFRNTAGVGIIFIILTFFSGIDSGWSWSSIG